MAETNNFYINKLNLNPVRENAVRKLLKGVGGVNDSTPLVEELNGDELILVKQGEDNKAVSVEQIKNKVINGGVIEFPIQPANAPTTINLKELKDKVDTLETDGDGAKFLADDGEYKKIDGVKFNSYTLSFTNGAGIITNEVFQAIRINTQNNRNFFTIQNYDNEGNCIDYHYGFAIDGYYMFNQDTYFEMLTSEGKIVRVTMNRLDINNSAYGTADHEVSYEIIKDLDNSPYIWDMTINETIFNELLECYNSQRLIKVNDMLFEPVYGTNSEIIIISKYFYSIPYVITKMALEITKTTVTDYTAGNFISYLKQSRTAATLENGIYINLGTLTANTTYSKRVGVNILLNEHQGEFSFGDTIYTVTFPSTIKWSTDSVLEYKTNHTYQFKIVNSLGVMKEFAI